MVSLVSEMLGAIESQRFPLTLFIQKQKWHYFKKPEMKPYFLLSTKSVIRISFRFGKDPDPDPDPDSRSEVTSTLWILFHSFYFNIKIYINHTYLLYVPSCNENRPFLLKSESIERKLISHVAFFRPCFSRFWYGFF